MHSLSLRNNNRGMSLIELLIVIGLTTLVFGSLLGTFQFMVSLIGSSKAQAPALALANEQMEYIRSLPYDDVGTISGIPDGLIPQNSSTTLNGIVYNQRVLIQYVDAPQDGEGASDENGILADYKQVKVEYSWEFRGEAKTISLISNIVPEGIETTAGGGTLTVNVFDAAVQPVSGASVRVYNNTGTSTIDVTRNTNANGVAMFSGAPALAGYEITVSKTGYSSTGTYTASSTNPNPVTLPVAVLESQVSTMNFQIDELSDLTVETIGEPTTDSFDDLFDDSTQVGSATNVTVVGSEAVLSGAPGSYSASGELSSVAVDPGSIDSWDTVSFDARIPTDTTLVVRVYDATSSTSPVLVPDADLPGNSTGFAPGTIDIRALDPATYQALALEAELTTADTATTSALLEWSIAYTVSAPALPNIPFTFTGSKIIGTNASGTSLYKYDESFTTDGTGDVTISDLEWDVYDVVITDSAYDVAEACENIPYALDPGVDETLVLTLVPSSANSLRVRIEDSSGEAIPAADITLSRSGFNDDALSSACGSAFFNSGVSSANDYTVSVTATGYVDQTVSNIDISGSDALTVIMVET